MMTFAVVFVKVTSPTPTRVVSSEFIYVTAEDAGSAMI